MMSCLTSVFQRVRLDFKHDVDHKGECYFKAIKIILFT